MDVRITKTNWILIGFLFLAFLLGGYFVWCRYFIFTDGTAYALLGKSLAQGEGMRLYGDRHIYFPPGYPLLIAAIYLAVRNLELAAHLVPLMAYIGTVGLTFILAGLLRPSCLFQVCATGLVLLHPAMLDFAGLVMSESLLTALLLSAAIYAWVLSTQRKSSVWLWIAWSLSLGLAYLTRSDGILYLPLHGLFLLFFSVEERKVLLRKMSLALICFGLVIAPYILFIHQATGHWQLSGKTAIIMNYAKVKMAGSDGRTESQLTSQLAKDGTSFTIAQQEEASLLTYVWHNPKEASLRIVHNGRLILAKPDFAWGAVLLLFYLFMRIRNLRSLWNPFFILILLHAIPIGLFLLLFVEERFLLPFLPFWALGNAAFIEWLWKKSRPHIHRITVRGLFLFACIAIMAAVGFGLHNTARIQQRIERTWNSFHDLPLEHKAMGEWMKKNLPISPTTRISHRNPWVSFYAGGMHIRTPYTGDLEELCEWAHKNNVEYVVVDERMTKAFMPVLEFLLDDTQPHPGLEPIHIILNPKIVLFRFTPQEKDADR